MTVTDSPSDYYGVSVQTIRQWIIIGAFPAVRIGPRLIRIKRSDILKTPKSDD